MAAKYFDLQITALQAVGATCTNFQIQWEDLDCMNLVCEVGSDGILHVQVPEDCEFDCATALITCLDPCTNCEPVRVEVCPCVTDDDCDSCSSCINNLCVSICLDGQTCIDGRCVDCTDDTDCPDGQICSNGVCICPPPLVMNKYGECVQCLTGDCPPCYVCDPDLGCIPIECPDGQLCDPSTGDCVDCVADGDCGPNEICEDGECVCEPGFTRNSDGDCVPDPCTDDDDCPDGYECKDGVCVPIECPDGFILVGEDCYELCTCGLQECPPGMRCTPVETIYEVLKNTLDGEVWYSLTLAFPGQCFCFSEGDLPPTDGCGDKLCESQDDCPEGCGCVGGVCLPCTSLDCDNCPDPNCICIGDDCLAVESPECNDGGDLELVLGSCDLKAEYTLTSSCPCEPMTLLFNPNLGTTQPDDTYITLGYTLEVKKGYAATPDYALNQLFNVSDQDQVGIADNEEPSSGSIEVKAIAYGKKLNNLGGIDPGTPDTAINTWTSIHAFTNIGTSTQAAVGGMPLYKPGEDVEQGGFTYRIQRNVVAVYQKSDFSFPNTCDYEVPTTVGYGGIVIGAFVFGEAEWTDYENSNPWNYLQYLSSRSIFSEDTRNPLFTWYRTLPGTSGFQKQDIFREVYVEKTGSKYIDTLLGPDELPATGSLSGAEGELFAGFNYAVIADCACSEAKLQSIQAIFCQPDSPTAVFAGCNTTIEINDFLPICDVNQDLKQWNNPPTYTIPDQAQVVFDLEINGSVVATYQHDATAADVVDTQAGTTLFQAISDPQGQNISTAALIVRTEGGVEMCRHDFTPDATNNRDDMVASDPTCIDGQPYFEVTFNAGANPVGTITGVSPYPGTTILSATEAAGVWTVRQTKGETMSIIVTWNDGCTYRYDYVAECCNQLVAITSHAFTTITVAPDGTDNVSFLATGITGTVVWTLLNRTNGSQIGASVSGGSTYTATNLGRGQYTIQIEDELDCPPATLDFDVQESTPQDIDISCPSPSTVCKGAIVTIAVTSNEAVTVQYNIVEDGGGTTGPFSLVFANAGTQTITVDTSAGGTFTYDFTSPAGLGECEITVEGDIVPTISFSPDPVCSDSSVDITVTGEPDSTATIDYYGTLTIPTSGTRTVSWNHNLTPDTYTVGISTTSSSGCISTGTAVTLEVLDSDFGGLLSYIPDVPVPPETVPVTVQWLPDVGVIGDYTYSWYPTPDSGAGTNSATWDAVSLTSTIDGILTVTKTADGCPKDFPFSITVNSPTLVEIVTVPGGVVITDDPYVIGVEVDTLVTSSVTTDVTYLWTEVSGPPGGTLIPGSNTVEIPTLRPNVAGTYVLELEITNTVTGEISTDTINILAQVDCLNGNVESNTIDCVNTGYFLTAATYNVVATPADASSITVTLPVTVTDCDGNVVAGYPSSENIEEVSSLQIAMISQEVVSHGYECPSVDLEENNGGVYTTRNILTAEANRIAAGCGGAIAAGELTYNSADPSVFFTALVKQIKSYACANYGVTADQVKIDDATVQNNVLVLRGTITNNPSGLIIGISNGLGASSASLVNAAADSYTVAGSGGVDDYTPGYYRNNEDLIFTSECGTNITVDLTWDDRAWNNLVPETVTAYNFDTLTLAATVPSSHVQPTNGTGIGTASCLTTTLTIDPTVDPLAQDPCNGDPLASYQWQDSATGLPGSWSDLPGETNMSYTVPYGSMNYYRVHVTCPNGCDYFIEP